MGWEGIAATELTAIAHRIHPRAHSSLSTQSTSPQEALSILNAQRMRRPSSPHFTIYEPQLSWLSSIANRVTGNGLSIGARVHSAEVQCARPKVADREVHVPRCAHRHLRRRHLVRSRPSLHLWRLRRRVHHLSLWQSANVVGALALFALGPSGVSL